MKKILTILVLALIVILGVSFLARNVLIKSASQRMIRDMTGMDLEIDRLNVGVFSTTLEIEGLRLINPPGYSEPTAFDINELYVDYNFFSLFTDEIRLNELRMDIASATVIKNEAGESNVDGLKQLAGDVEDESPVAGETREPTSAPAPSGEETAPPEDEPAAPPKNMRIDDLAITLGNVNFLDYSRGGPEPVSIRHALGVEIHEQNVTDPNQIVALVMGQLFMGALGNLGSLADFGAGQLAGMADDADVQVEEIQAAAEQTLQQLGSALDEMTKDPDSPLSQLLGAVGGDGAVDDAKKGLGQAQEAVAEESGGVREGLSEAAGDAAGDMQKGGQEAEDTTKQIQKEVGNLLKGFGGSDSK